MKYKNTIIQRFSAINLSGGPLFIFIINNISPGPATPHPYPFPKEWGKNFSSKYLALD